MLDERSKHLRRLCLRAFKAAKKGHLGSSYSLIEILRVLYDDIAVYAPEFPQWEHRDRIILSKGHGGLALFAMLADKGFFPMGELDKFCQMYGILGGHPSHKVPGIEFDTGALGHGLPIAVGTALALSIKGVDKRVFCIVGDGELNEGSNWEAMLSASKHKLSNLTVIVDYNKIQSAGFVNDICPLESLKDKFIAFGFDWCDVTGHNIEALKWAMTRRRHSQKPDVIIVHTVKGCGISFAENNPQTHYYSNFDDEMLAKIEVELQ